jgi:hypothetical protein
MDEASTPLAAPPRPGVVTFAYDAVRPACFTKPCGLVPVVAAITVETDGPVLSTTAEKPDNELEFPTTSLAATE